MLRKNRLYGLMAGITAGFAVWGALPAVPAAGVTEERTAENTVPAASPSAEDPAAELFANLHAGGAVLMDGESGRILFSRNGEDFRPIASTTKLMTCILALEEAEPDTVCTFSRTAAAQPKVRLGARAGEEFCLKDLLYSLMLESHNDTAVAVAEAVAGSVPDFAGRMNRKAQEIGCADTYFITPSGLDAQETGEDGNVRIHGSTAADLARILRYCVMDSPRREEFLRITQTSNYSFADRSGRKKYSCRNHNALLSLLPGLICGKTGFTGGAGYCYAGAYRSEGRTFILALLGCGWPPHRTWKWEDAKAIFSYGEKNYSYGELPQMRRAWKVPVAGGEEAYVLAFPAGRSREAGGLEKTRFLLCARDRMTVRTELPASLAAPVKKGQRIGSLVYELNGEEIHRTALVADRGSGKRTLWHELREILKVFRKIGCGL